VKRVEPVTHLGRTKVIAVSHQAPDAVELVDSFEQVVGVELAGIIG
jgi:hypothetical protein